MSRLFSFSIERIASSMTVPISSLCAAPEITVQRDRRRYEEYVLFSVSVLVFHIVIICFEFMIAHFKLVGNIFQKYQSQDDVLVFRRIHVPAQDISRRPDLLLKSDFRR